MIFLIAICTHLPWHQLIRAPSPGQRPFPEYRHSACTLTTPLLPVASLCDRFSASPLPSCSLRGVTQDTPDPKSLLVPLRLASMAAGSPVPSPRPRLLRSPLPAQQNGVWPLMHSLHPRPNTTSELHPYCSPACGWIRGYMGLWASLLLRFPSLDLLPIRIPLLEMNTCPFYMLTSHPA